MEITRLTRSKQLVRVRRGAYAAVSSTAHDLTSRHRQLIEATVRQSHDGAVVSHVSAAVMHRLPLWSTDLERVHLTRDRRGGGRQRRYVVVHGHPLEAHDVVLVDDLQTTSLARTVVDLSCCLPADRAIALGDAALRSGLERCDLDEQLARAGRRTGIGRARRVIGLLDPRSESPGESRSRLLFIDHRVPAPELQFTVLDRDARLIGRSDFGWPELRTLGEFDGRIKYGRSLHPGRDIEDVLFAEKRREDAMRELGWQMVRWTWSDLAEPENLTRRLQRAFDRGRQA